MKKSFASRFSKLGYKRPTSAWDNLVSKIQNLRPGKSPLSIWPELRADFKADGLTGESVARGIVETIKRVVEEQHKKEVDRVVDEEVDKAVYGQRGP